MDLSSEVLHSNRLIAAITHALHSLLPFFLPLIRSFLTSSLDRDTTPLVTLLFTFLSSTFTHHLDQLPSF